MMNVYLRSNTLEYLVTVVIDGLQLKVIFQFAIKK